MKFGLSKENIQKINAVFAKYPEVEEAWIYGSRAKEIYREGSDIDITLKGAKLTDGIRSKIFWDIDELNTPYLFDISIFDKILSHALKEQINNSGKIFYKK